jgi:HEAT repeat protein
VIEHSYATAAELLARGVPAAVVARLDAVDARPYEPVGQRLARLRRCPGAVLLARAVTLERLHSGVANSWRRRQQVELLAALDAELVSDDYDIGPLVTALGADRTEDRWYAAELLGLLRAADAVAPLAAAVEQLGADHSTAELRFQFLRAIGRIMTGGPGVWLWSRQQVPPDPSWRPTLNGWLAHSNPDVRQLAVTLLGRRHDAGDLDHLLAALSDGEAGVAAAAARSLSHASFWPARDRLHQLLSDSEAAPMVRAAAAHALGAVGGRDNVAALVEALGDSHGMVRTAAAQALRRIAGPDVIPMLRDLLRRGSSEAAWVLGQLRATDAVPDLLDGLARTGGEHYLLWDRCAEALGKIALPDAVEGLAAAYHGHRAPARAIWALGRIGADHALETVLAATHDTNPGIRVPAVRALATATDPRAVPRLIELCEGPHTQVAVRALLRAADRRAMRTLEHVVSTAPDQTTRRLAGQALVRLRPRWTELSDQLHLSRDVKVRRVQAWLFGHVGDVDIDPEFCSRRLAQLLGDRDPIVRARAAESLGRRRAATATFTLEKALTDVAPRVRANAASALGMIGDPQCRDALTSAVSDPHKDVRAAAAAAIRRLQ